MEFSILQNSDDMLYIVQVGEKFALVNTSRQTYSYEATADSFFKFADFQPVAQPTPELQKEIEAILADPSNDFENAKDRMDEGLDPEELEELWKLF